jgi:hypothetical protein
MMTPETIDRPGGDGKSVRIEQRSRPGRHVVVERRRSRPGASGPGTERSRAEGRSVERASSTTSLNIQIIAVSIAGTSAIEQVPSPSAAVQSRSRPEATCDLVHRDWRRMATSACESGVGIKSVRTLARRRRHHLCLECLSPGAHDDGAPPSAGPSAGVYWREANGTSALCPWTSSWCSRSPWMTRCLFRDPGAPGRTSRSGRADAFCVSTCLLLSVEVTSLPRHEGRAKITLNGCQIAVV